jgi:RNA polymerase sigma-70 factor (ECF subfamily)
MVLASTGDGETLEARRALSELFQTYWYPLYAYIRRRGYSEHDAQDLVQSFCVHLQENHALEKADRERGKFRTFLLSSLQNFLSHETERARAQKRGGGAAVIELDAQDAEARFRLEPKHSITPEAIFEKRWAHALLEQTLTSLRTDFATRGKERLFDSLSTFLTADRGEEPYQSAADRLGLPLSAIKTTVHRLRRDYREKLREEIARTVSSVNEVDDELRHLRHVLASAA